MWPALKTLSPNSNSPFFRGYYLWIVIIAFALSLILYWAFRLPDTEPESATEGAPVLTAEAESVFNRQVFSKSLNIGMAHATGCVWPVPPNPTL